MSVKVLSDQKLVDLCMQEYGDASFLFEAAQGVGKSITDELDAIVELELPVLTTSALGKSIMQVLQKPFNNPASADDASEDQLSLISSISIDATAYLPNPLLTRVYNNQRLIDLCMQEYGDVEKLFEVAIATGKKITDELDGVENLQMPVLTFSNNSKSISQLLRKSFNNPASADDNEVDIYLPPGGIGYMKLENTFIVS